MKINKNAVGFIGDAQLLADEAKYSSFGDTVHYCESAEDLRALRRQLSLRRGRHAVPRSADVVFGGQFRLRAIRVSTTR